MATGPRARTQDLVVEELGEEVVVFDTERGTAHCLDRAAGRVWRACDGKRDTIALARAAGVSTGAVVSALNQLAECDLLDDPRRGLSRRQALVRAVTAGAVGTLGLPVVKSIVAPEPAYAASGTCIPHGEPCGGIIGPGQCAAFGLCCDEGDACRQAFDPEHPAEPGPCTCTEDLGD